MTAQWRPMTDLERRCALALGVVRYPVASPPKRLARSLLSQARESSPVVTDAQADAMWRQAYRFRRQIADPDVAATASEREHQVYERENGHEWCKANGTVNHPYCRVCLKIRRADGTSNPCTGAAQLRTMEPLLAARGAGREGQGA